MSKLEIKNIKNNPKFNYRNFKFFDLKKNLQIDNHINNTKSNN